MNWPIEKSLGRLEVACIRKRSRGCDTSARGLRAGLPFGQAFECVTSRARTGERPQLARTVGKAPEQRRCLHVVRGQCTVEERPSLFGTSPSHQQIGAQQLGRRGRSDAQHGLQNHIAVFHRGAGERGTCGLRVCGVEVDGTPPMTRRSEPIACHDENLGAVLGDPRVPDALVTIVEHRECPLEISLTAEPERVQTIRSGAQRHRISPPPERRLGAVSAEPGGRDAETHLANLFVLR